MLENGGEYLSTKKRNRDRRVVIPGNGDPCPRCGVPMQIREYYEVTKKKLRQSYFYTRWFCCMNKRCRTTLSFNARRRTSSFGLLRRADEDDAAPLRNIELRGFVPIRRDPDRLPPCAHPHARAREKSLKNSARKTYP
jgi:hypothetical protein